MDSIVSGTAIEPMRRMSSVVEDGSVSNDESTRDRDDSQDDPNEKPEGEDDLAAVALVRSVDASPMIVEDNNANDADDDDDDEEEEEEDSENVSDRESAAEDSSQGSDTNVHGGSDLMLTSSDAGGGDGRQRSPASMLMRHHHNGIVGDSPAPPLGSAASVILAGSSRSVSPVRVTLPGAALSSSPRSPQQMARRFTPYQIPRSNITNSNMVSGNRLASDRVLVHSSVENSANDSQRVSGQEQQQPPLPLSNQVRGFNDYVRSHVPTHGASSQATSSASMAAPALEQAPRPASVRSNAYDVPQNFRIIQPSAAVLAPPPTTATTFDQRAQLQQQQQQERVQLQNPQPVAQQSQQQAQLYQNNNQLRRSSVVGNRTIITTKTPSKFPFSSDLQQAGAAILGDRYILLDLCDGTSLYKCIDTKTKEEYVCKIANNPCTSLLEAHFRLEGHLHINPFKKVIHGTQQTYLFFEPSQGDLHSYVRTRKRLREAEAKRLFRQMCETVKACHDQGIVLRDLKLRKFIFADEEKTQLRLESLEDAVVLENPKDDLLQDKRGCPAYVSPEILKANTTYSGKAADMWSLGVILYTMLVGRYPFNDSEHASLFAKISRGHFHVPECLSSKARCVIRSLLRRHPEERITSEDILHHPWLTKENFRETVRSCSDQTVPMWEPSERAASLNGGGDDEDEDEEGEEGGGDEENEDGGGEEESRGSLRGRSGVSFLGPSLSARFGFVGDDVLDNRQSIIDQIHQRRLNRMMMM